MISPLRRLVDLREGEARPTALASVTLALLIAGHTMLETARDALFLEKLPPERLTLVYVLLAGLTFFVGGIASRFSQRFGRMAALVFTLLACAYAITVIYLRPATASMAFALYLTSGVIGTVLLLQFWMLTGDLFTVAQGKRLFGPIGAGGGVGATLGASLAALALRFVSVESLLPCAAFTFLMAGLVVVRLPVPFTEDSSRPAAAPKLLALLEEMGMLKKDAYVRKVALLTSLGTAAVLLADYLFKSAAATHIDKASLGEFFAMFYAIVNGVALIVQLFVTGAVVRRLGVMSSLLVLPLLLVTGGVGAALGAGFIGALAAKGADGSLRHSLHRVTSELILLPLPGKQRERLKPLLDTLFGRGIQALVACLIMGLTAVGLADPRILGACLAGVAISWALTALVLRRSYVDLFRKALSLGQLKDETSLELDLASVETLMETLSSREEERVLAAMDVLNNEHRARLLPALILYHDSPKVLEAALGIVATPDRKDWIPLADRLLDHPESGVRGAAVKALLATGATDIAKRALLDPHHEVRIAAAFFLSRAAHTSSERFDFENDERLVPLLNNEADHAEDRLVLLDLLAQHGDPRFQGIVARIAELDGRRRGVAARIAQAAEKTGEVEVAPYLLDNLAVGDGRREIRSALVSFGATSFALGVRLLRDKRTNLRTRRAIPHLLASFRDQAAVDVLSQQLPIEESGTVRYKLLRALGRLSTDAKQHGLRLKFDAAVFEEEARRNLVEHVRLQGFVATLGPNDATSSLDDTQSGRVLYGLLGDKIEQSLERVFRCLGLAHRNEDIEGVYTALSRGDKRSRGNVVEFLDSLTLENGDAKSLLLLVVDELSPSQVADRANEIVPRLAKDHDSAIRVLLSDPDDLLAGLAAEHALELGRLDLRPIVTTTLEHRPTLVRFGASTLALEPG